TTVPCLRKGRSHETYAIPAVLGHAHASAPGTGRLCRPTLLPARPRDGGLSASDVRMLRAVGGSPPSPRVCRGPTRRVGDPAPRPENPPWRAQVALRVSHGDYVIEGHVPAD